MLIAQRNARTLRTVAFGECLHTHWHSTHRLPHTNTFPRHLMMLVLVYEYGSSKSTQVLSRALFSYTRTERAHFAARAGAL